MLPNDVGPAIGAGLAAGFVGQTDIFDLHAPVDGLAHVVDRQRGGCHGRQCLHLDAGGAGRLDGRLDAQPVGDRLDIDITALLSEASPMYPDARAAALAVEAVSDLTGLEIPLTELLENARSIEDSVRDIIENASQMLPAPEDDSVTDIDPSFG